MSKFEGLSSLVLQVSSQTAASAGPDDAASSQTIDNILDSAFIWLALIMIGVLVFGYRKTFGADTDGLSDLKRDAARAKGKPEHRD